MGLTITAPKLDHTPIPEPNRIVTPTAQATELDLFPLSVATPNRGGEKMFPTVKL